MHGTRTKRGFVHNLTKIDDWGEIKDCEIIGKSFRNQCLDTYSW